MEGMIDGRQMLAHALLFSFKLLKRTMLILQLICSSEITDLETIAAIFDAAYIYLTEEGLIDVSLGIMGFSLTVNYRPNVRAC